MRSSSEEHKKQKGGKSIIKGRMHRGIERTSTHRDVAYRDDGQWQWHGWGVTRRFSRQLPDRAEKCSSVMPCHVMSSCVISHVTSPFLLSHLLSSRVTSCQPCPVMPCHHLSCHVGSCPPHVASRHVVMSRRITSCMSRHLFSRLMSRRVVTDGRWFLRRKKHNLSCRLFSGAVFRCVSQSVPLGPLASTCSGLGLGRSVLSYPRPVADTRPKQENKTCLSSGFWGLGVFLRWQRPGCLVDSHTERAAAGIVLHVGNCRVLQFSWILGARFVSSLADNAPSSGRSKKMPLLFLGSTGHFVSRTGFSADPPAMDTP